MSESKSGAEVRLQANSKRYDSVQAIKPLDLLIQRVR
jgi:hypothetical protein